MKRKFWFWVATLITSFVAITMLSQVVTGQGVSNPPGMMMQSGMKNSGGAQTIHQLFAYHDQIRRSVKEIPGGIRAITESDNPEITALIQAHVTEMYTSISEKKPIPMIGMSSTLPIMTQADNLYQRHLRMTDKGIEVTETSDNPEMVVVIQDHAQEVSEFVRNGMSGMMNKMMR